MTNPSTNLYALTALTITLPSGWTISPTGTCTSGSFLKAVGCSLTTAQWSVGTGSALAPGSSDQVGISVLAPSPTSPLTYPYVGTFTSTVQDASNLAFYAGPSFQLSVIDPNTAFTFTTDVTTPYVAGSAAETVTVTQTAGVGITQQAGLVIDWTLSGASVGYGSYSLTASSVTTVSGGVATASATFSPSDTAGDHTALQAEVGSSGVLAISSVVTTIAGAPSTVAFLAGGSPFPSTYYISGENAGVNFGHTVVGTATLAEIASAATIGVTAADHFGNPVDFGAITSPTITIQALSGAGGWDNGGASLLTQISCTSPAGAVSCAGGTEGQISLNYFQGYAYATVGELEATITGTYAAAPFTAPGTSGNIFTSAQATSLTASPSIATNVQAGTYVDVAGNLTGSTQLGVPMTLGLCVNNGVDCGTAGYGGTNSGFGTAGGLQVTEGGSALTTHSTVSGFGSKYFVDTTLGSMASFNVTATDPYNGHSTFTLAWTTSLLATTTPGVASTLGIVFYYKSTTPSAAADPIGIACTAPCNPLANIVAGTVVYPDATLEDAYGNVVLNTQPFQAQIQLSATAGSLSATTVYINSGGSDTWSSFGAIAYYTPSGAAVGTVLKVTGSGLVAGLQVSGFATLTVVSPTPTFSIVSPTGQLNGVIYTTTAATVFHGWANVSSGYDGGPTTITTINQIGYSVNSGHWQTAVLTPGNTIKFSIAAFLSLGLNTVQFNATDSQSNMYISPKYQVLVDNTLPGIKFSKTTSFAFGTTVPVTIFSNEGDLNTSAVSAYYGNNDLNVTAANLVGTNTLGTNSSFTLNLNGIPTGTWTLKVSATSYAGSSVTATETITVTISFADSVQYVANSASFTTEGAYKGVLASFTNGWSSTQSLVIFVQYTNSSGSWVYAGSTSIASGATAQVFVPITVPHISPGTYTLTMFAVTTANLPVSVSTTITGFAVS